MKRNIKVVIILVSLLLTLVGCAKEEKKKEVIKRPGVIISNSKEINGDRYINVIEFSNGETWSNISVRQIVQTDREQIISMGDVEGRPRDSTFAVIEAKKE